MKSKFYLTYWLRDNMEIHSLNSEDVLSCQFEVVGALPYLLNLGAEDIHITDCSGKIIYRIGR